MAAVSYFDLDGTLVQGSAVFSFTRALAPVISASSPTGTSRSALIRMLAQHAHFRFSGREGNVASLAQVALTYLAGTPVDELAHHAGLVRDEVMGRIVRPASWELIARRRAAGDVLVLATAAPQLIADEAARFLRLDAAIGTVLDHEDGLFTGTVSQGLCHAQGKADAVSQHAHRHCHLLSQASAFSDSFNDLPLLNMVGNPTVVNPDGPLLAYAQQHRWPIVVTSPRRQAARVALPALTLAAAIPLGAAAFTLTRRNLR
jgi:HAD superfamily hydrolase (TIGR01490 family)